MQYRVTYTEDRENITVEDFDIPLEDMCEVMEEVFAILEHQGVPAYRLEAISVLRVRPEPEEVNNESISE